MAMTLADRLELPNNHRRFIHLYIRGVKRTSTVIYEDAQQPNSDFLAEWYPGKDEGQLFKLEVWWGIADAPLVSATQPAASLVRFNRSWPGITNTTLDLAHYRLNWLPRGVNGTADDYRAFSNLVAAVENPASTNYTASVTTNLNDEQWMRTLAFERAVNNQDSYSLGAGHNMYAYHDLANTAQKWQLLMIDLDGIFQGNPAGVDPFALNPFADARANNMIQHPPFRRAMWRCLYDLANPTDGVMLTNVVNPMFEGNIAALAANGYTVPSTTATNSDQNWIATRRNYLWTRLAEVRPSFTNALLVATNAANSTIVLSGLAPVEVRTIKLNGNMLPLTWTTVTNWSITTNTSPGSNFFQVIGYDRKTNALPVRDVGGYTNQIIIMR